MRCIFIGCCLLLGCSQAKRENNQDVQESFTLSQLEGEWQRLTEWDNGQLVIFKPCDADNMMMQVSSDTLLIGWGQDATVALIKSFYTDEDRSIVLAVADLDENTRETYVFRFDDPAKKLARWWLYGKDETPEFFAHEDIVADYSSYEQPCSECWDDCEEE